MTPHLGALNPGSGTRRAQMHVWGPPRPDARARDSARQGRATPEKITATFSPGLTRPWDISSPASPAAPVALTGIDVVAAICAARDDGLLGDDVGDPAAGPHHREIAEPVVGLVVEDAVGERVRMLPWRHQLAPPRAERGLRNRRVLRSPPGPRERGATLGLNGVEAHGWPEAPPDARRERTTTDLHHDTVEALVVARPGGGVGQLPTERAAAVEAQGVLRTLHAEGQHATGNGLAEAQHGRVARRVAREPRAHGDPGVERLEQREHVRRGPLRHVHLERPRHRPGDGGGGDGGVATRGDRERRPPRTGSQAEQLGRAQVEHDADEVAALVAAADVAGLVLDPHRRRRVDARRVGKVEHVAVHRGDHEASGDLGGERHEGRFRHPVGRRECPPRHARSVGDERVGIVEPLRCRAGHEWVEHVMAVGRRGPRADERVRHGDVERRGAHRAAPADDAGGPSCHGAAEPTRPLKSVIISSHTSRNRRRPRQNVC